MARYRSSSGSSSRCFNERDGWDSYSTGSYACVVLFMLVFFGILASLCIFRRKAGPGRRLIGVPYILALSLETILYIMSVVTSTLSACRAGFNDRETVYDTNIAFRVLTTVETMLFLFVFIYALNSMLRKHLGHFPSVLKVSLAVLLAVIGVLIATVTVLQAITYYWTAHYRWSWDIDIASIGIASLWVGLALNVVTLIAVLGSGALSISAARSIRKRHAGNKLFMIWIVVLVVCVVGFSAITLARSIQSLPVVRRYNYSYDYAGDLAATWIFSIFYATAYFSFIMIAKNPVWRTQKSDTVMVEEGYAYNPAQQTYGNDYPHPGSHA